MTVHVWFLPDSGSHPVSLFAAFVLGYGKDSLDSSLHTFMEKLTDLKIFCKENLEFFAPFYFLTFFI